MKSLKYILIPVLGGLLFTACNNAPAGPTQAELDTQVEAKVKAATDQLATDCNTRILQAAQLQADSMLAKLGNKPTPIATKPKTTKPTPPPPVKPTPPTIGNGKPQMGGQDPNKVGTGKPKMGGSKNEEGKVDDTKVGSGKPKMGGK
ncbi:MAG: hypothetical protein IPI46_09360 [Bacteroidetes bacterium]|nr:hypothetical protein [Bacteroidota bacterium]